MTAIATTGLTEYYGGMTAVDDYGCAGDEDGMYNVPRYGLMKQR